MQTFLPYERFHETAAVLDYRRLGKQRVEAKQIYETLVRGRGGWVNHPAVQMWRGCLEALALYGLIVCEEWVRRGYRDTLTPWFMDRYKGEPKAYPAVIGWEPYHTAHKSNLIRKDAVFYGPLWPDVPDDLPYLWGRPKRGPQGGRPVSKITVVS